MTDFQEAGGEGEKLLLHKKTVILILDKWLSHYSIKIAP